MMSSKEEGNEHVRLTRVLKLRSDKFYSIAIMLNLTRGLFNDIIQRIIKGEEIMKLVSIIIPVYNRGKMVIEAIKSCLRQTYQNIEIVVVNDGSTDDTLEKIEELQEQYANIKIISQANQGVSKARITGLNNANGEYIMFLDSDDLISKNYVYSLVQALEYSKATVALARRYQEMGPLRILYNKYPGFMDLKQDKHFLPTFWVGVNCKLYERRDLELLDYGLKANEDLAFNYYDLASRRYISCNNAAIYTQRFAENSLAKNLIYGNLDHIDNTIKPLEIEHKLFSDSKLLDEYSLELEAVFIKNIFERIFNIWMSKEPKERKIELINCLLRYLNFHFPNWKANKYYLENFKGFPFDSKMYENITAFLIRNITTDEISSGSETIESFNSILRK